MRGGAGGGGIFVGELYRGWGHGGWWMVGGGVGGGGGEEEEELRCERWSGRVGRETMAISMGKGGRSLFCV